MRTEFRTDISMQEYIDADNLELTESLDYNIVMDFDKGLGYNYQTKKPGEHLINQVF
jgi:hypothetical protein